LQAQAREEAANLLRDQLIEFQRRVESAAAELDNVNRALADARTEIKQTGDDRAALRRQIDAERAVADAARKESENRERAHEERWALEVDRARESTKTLQVQLFKLEKEYSSRVEQLSESLTQTRMEAARFRELHDRAQLELGQSIQASSVSTQAMESLRVKLDEREAQWTEDSKRLQAQLTSLIAQLAAKDQEHGVLLHSLVTNAETKRKSYGRQRQGGSERRNHKQGG
jgi:hypothetical protein